MAETDFERVMRELAVAELEDETLHKQPSSLDERVRSHQRLNELRAEAARLRKPPRPPRRSRTDRGVRLFPPGS